MVFVVIWYQMDTVMLSMLAGDTVVGWYNAASKLQSVVLVLPGVVVTAIYPVMSRYQVTSQDLLRSSFEKSVRYLTVLGVPIGVGTTLLASKLIPLVFGNEFTNSIIALQILVWAWVAVFMSISYGNLLNSLNLQSTTTKITGICVTLNTVLNLLLIPTFGLAGAGVARVATEASSLLLAIILTRKLGYHSTNLLATTFLKALTASAVMASFILVSYDWALIQIIPVAVLLYLAVLTAVQGIDAKEIYLLWRARELRGAS
jgi:O-antigen/teichoic acid export membrane protein